MKQLQRLLRPAWAAVLVTIGLAPVGSSAFAQKPVVRLSGPIVGESKTALAGSRSPRASAANDVGVLPANTAINGITLVFKRTEAQETALQSLLAAQTNPASPQFHQWLTPEQFGAQFGVADADITTTESWLASQGFTAMSVSPSRDRITFSGTGAQVATAFGTELHQYRADNANGSTGSASKPNYAPSTDLSLPAALAPMVLSVEHLSTFRPKPQLRLGSIKPQYTSNITGRHFLTPPDIATMYNVSPVYNSGFNGTGQTIAIASQTYIQLSDVQHFQAAAGLPNNPPTLFLMPGTGGSAIYQGDEAESDLDVEYALGMARGANVIMLYTGDSPNFHVFDAVSYAVDHKIGSIISLSYGGCELGSSTTELNQYNQMAEQASSQGQTIVTATGDNGSTTCFGDTTLTLAQQQTPSVGVIADLPDVTGVGGLQMQAGTYAIGNTQYFAASTGTDNISSLLSYVPETVWNEDSTVGLLSGGGGASTVFPRPSWQTGVPGIPTGSFRLVPDISFQASLNSPGYLYCSSDPTAWASATSTSPAQVSSCTNGFRDSSTTLLTVAGGTSFATPIFAGMLAVLNQAKHVTSQGNINPVLYGLAGNSTTYASAFHDITTGSNACTAASTSLCSTAGAAVYGAGVGYDEASGLGSINFANLVAAWPSTTAASLAATTTTLSAATLTPASGATDAITVVVTSTTAGTPTGSVAISVDGGTAATVTLVNGQATFTYPGSTVGGSHLVTVAYSGDATYAPSASSITLTLAGTSIPTGSFTLAASSVTVATGSTGSSTVTLIPSGGYNGSVNFTITSTLPTNVNYCIQPIITNSTVPPIPQYKLTFGVGTPACPTGALRLGTGNAQAPKGVEASASANAPAKPWNGQRSGTVLAGLLAIGLVARRRTRGLPALLAIGALGLVISLGLSGCGGSSTTPVTAPVTSATAGTYNVTLVGVDSITSSITASTTLTLTIQ